MTQGVKRSTCWADGSVRYQAPQKNRQGLDNEDFHKRGSRLADEPFPFVALFHPVSLQDRTAWNRNGFFWKENWLQDCSYHTFPKNCVN